ncbi:glycoside hydrolase family 2 TIM barrel-domain containing protein [Saccharicrinis aurantiacus]|uniref:glycoside hydrolase family 2 TIM barrel-domain containing protein n=1 Tax=Saccharicrinis aurantiacus TaxID=1849719 RepID=UPI00094FC945|nr:glycoside hydrolase family 2 TIM barrel-domain containing protein [Saccharicrinis aurantiacus]
MKLSNLLVLILAIAFASCQQQEKVERETDFNFDWKFSLQKDTTIPTKIPMADADWRDIRLPHDWSVEASFDSTLEGCTGYLPGGVGVYQKHFATPVDKNEKSTFVLFDGVYNNATFWLNGTKLGENPYGYSPVYFDLTDLLSSDGSDNIITVHVDHSRYADSRWYTGSGIYRNVKLITVDKTRIPIWGTYLTTPEVSKDEATVKLEVSVENDLNNKSEFTITTQLINKAGTVVASASQDAQLGKKNKKAFTQNFKVSNPALWTPDTPNMYKAVTQISKSGKVVDEYTTPFGIRSLRFEAQKGFFLNGVETDVKGICIHHDGGLVGAAVPRGVWERRFKELKACGVNAIRTSHNPFSEEFLDLCDEMGFLVQDEIFDEFDYAKDKRQNYHDRHDDYITRGHDRHFQKWAKSDLTRTILRDRNHPSVFQWSIGNEIEWTYLHYRYVTGFWKDPKQPQNSGKYWGSAPMYGPEELKKRYDKIEKTEYKLHETAQKLNGWVKELDPSRTTTTNLVIPHVSMVTGYGHAVDVPGFSYRNLDIPWSQKHFPNKQVTINECPGTWDDWRMVLENPGVFSIYMWTGIGYIGERHGDWPSKSGWSDLLDIAGFKVQGWNYFKSIWVNKPHISLGTLPLSESGFKRTSISGQQLPENSGAYRWRDSNMHWNYEEGEMVTVEICSNHTIAELLVNGRSMGRKSMSECPDRIFRWTIPFEAGTITAKAGFEGQEVIAELHTTTKPVGIRVTPDKSTLKADAYDVSHLVVQLVDEKGREVKTENTKVEFEIVGDARLLGVDTGADHNNQDFQSNSIVTDKGRCLAIIQANKTKGTLKVNVKAEGFETQTISLDLK